MKTKINAINKDHLILLIKEEMNSNGKKCDLNHIDVSQITDMRELFNRRMLNEFNGNISEWDTKNVTNMDFLFYETRFNGDISKWDVSKVTTMSNMFYESRFNQSIANWNVSNVKNMGCLFCQARFNKSIAKWDVSGVEEMSYMFSYSKFNGDISKWNVAKVVDMREIFEESICTRPWWAIENYEKRQEILMKNELMKKLEKKLIKTQHSNKVITKKI